MHIGKCGKMKIMKNSKYVILEANDKTIRRLQPILREQERVLSLIRLVDVEIAENSGIEEAMKSAKMALENDKIMSLTLGANQYKSPALRKRPTKSMLTGLK